MSQAATTRARALLSEPPPLNSYDEYLDGSTPRPHQQLLYDFLQASDVTAIDHLRAVLQRHVNEQEITFNVLGSPEGANRPWQLDALPLVLDRESWVHLTHGLRQRARLLSALYADLYGPQRALAEGVIPAAAVLGNPAFERACFGWIPAGGHQIQLLAMDIGRDASGEFRVYSDRTAAPAGSGYALENRIAMAGALGDLFKRYRVERLRPFFDTLKNSLSALSSSGENGRTVVLSSGLDDQSAFEHAYLTRYLGYELVEGRDLTVRDRTVYLKTLSGLTRVDVILRRVSDSWCDPLSLRADSVLGVPGLISAARAGNVALANPLGAALMESPALRPYLPAAAKLLLGEPLKLASTDTWWCGDPESLAFVLNSLDELMIKPAFSDRRGAALTPKTMNDADKQQLVEALRANPSQYIAEAAPELSVAPVLSDHSLRYGQVSMRTFLCFNGGGYSVMPGGLGRINAAADGLFLSVEEEGLSKDVWVPSPEVSSEAPPPTMPDRRVVLQRGGADLPSRLLDDLYWLGRAIERCDFTTRVLRAGVDRLSSESGQDAPAGLERIGKTLQHLEVIPPTLVLDPNQLGRALSRAFSATGVPASLGGQMTSIHQLAVRARSRLSRDAWHNLHRVGALRNNLQQCVSLGDKTTLLDELLILLSAVRGTTIDNMVRSQGWTFLDMGRRVERGAQTLMLLQFLLAPGARRVHMEVLLEIADSMLTYRNRYLSSLQVAPVVDLLLTDDTNPRSVAFQAAELRRHVDSLPKLHSVVRSRAERRIIALHSNLLTADVAEICAGDGNVLRELLEDASNLLWQFSDDVNRTWLVHTPHSLAVSPPRWINEDLEVSQ